MNKKEDNLYKLSYTMRLNLYRRIFTVIGICFITCVITTIFMRFVLFPVRQQSTSMEPGIASDGWIFVTPLYRKFDRGDVLLIKALNEHKKTLGMNIADTVVSLFTAQQIFPFSRSNGMGCSYIFRRVIAVPGDSLYITGYIAFVKPAGESHYLTEFEYSSAPYKLNITTTPENWDDMLGAQADYKEITLGPDEYFVVSDSRNSGVDSRLWGPITSSAIKGKALLQYFPLSRFCPL